MKKIKKVKISLAVCIFGVIIMCIFLRLERQQFISQKIDNLESVTVLFNPKYPEKESVIYITERSEMERVYRMLKETTELSVNRHPYADSVQWDSRFAVRLEYSNGENDEFFATESEGGIFRFLNIRDNSSVRGYIIGSNEMLWEYVLTVK